MLSLRVMSHLTPLILLWITAEATSRGPLLAPFLPKKTFIVPHSRFQPRYENLPSSSRGLYSQRDVRTQVVFPQSAPMAPQRLIHTNTRTLIHQRTGTYPQNQVVHQGSQGLPYSRISNPQIHPTQLQPQGMPGIRISNASPQQVFPQPPSVTQSQPTTSTNNRHPVIPQAVNPQENFVVRPSSRHPKCNQLPPPGDCRGAFPRYFYNNITDQCDCFLYGGCGQDGIDYSFRSLEECVDSCVPANLEEGPVCMQIFQEEDYFFDVPEVSSESPSPSNQIGSNQEVDDIPDDVFLTILLRSANSDASLGGTVGAQRNSLRQ